MFCFGKTEGWMQQRTQTSVSCMKVDALHDHPPPRVPNLKSKYFPPRYRKGTLNKPWQTVTAESFNIDLIQGWILKDISSVYVGIPKPLVTHWLLVVVWQVIGDVSPQKLSKLYKNVSYLSLWVKRNATSGKLPIAIFHWRNTRR